MRKPKVLLTVLTVVSSSLVALTPEPSTAAPAKSTGSVASSAAPLFGKGAETFKIEDRSGRTPQFRILDDSPSEKALAVGIITALNAQNEVQPKLPVADYIDVKVESLKLAASSETSDELSLDLRLSGYNIEFEQTVSRKKFLNGETIQLDFPKTNRNVAIFDVNSSGKLRMRLDRSTNNVVIDEVNAKMDFASSFAGNGEEAIKFSGKGIRQIKK